MYLSVCGQDRLNDEYTETVIIVCSDYKQTKEMGQCVSQSPRKHWQKKEMEEFLSIDDFRLIKLIGKGGFSKVWKVQDKKSGQIYALKVMDKAKIITKKSVKAVLQERRILSRLMEGGAEFVGGMHGSFQDQHNLYLLLDFLEGKSLRHHLNCGISLSETQIQWLVFAMLKALESLYRLHIIHRDIKPENIIFDKEGMPYLIDFGAASYFQENNSDCNSGTPGYMSPEVMQSQDHTYTADYYAIGVLTFQLFFKRRPYASTSAQLLKQIIKKPVNLENFPELSSLNSQAAAFIIGLLQRKQRNRLGFKEGVAQLLNHPWLKSLDCNNNIVIQLNHIRPQLCHIEDDNLSIELEDEQLSEQTQQNEQKFSNMLHRDHVQEMFSSFNSVPSMELFVPARKRSFDTEKNELELDRRSSLNLGQ